MRGSHLVEEMNGVDGYAAERSICVPLLRDGIALDRAVRAVSRSECGNRRKLEQQPSEPGARRLEA